MDFTRILSAALTGSAFLAAIAAAEPADFAPPVRIAAGDALAGAGRYYPSPVLHDLDGDGRADLVIGDLMGKVTVARRTDDGFAAEEPVLDRDGKPLKFHNW